MSKQKKTFDQVDLANLALKHDKDGTKIQEFDMRIDAMGQWYHQGDPIKRLGLVKLFASVLTRLDDGAYWLITPVERGKIEVEDAPFFVVTMDRGGDGKDQVISFKTSLDDQVELGGEHALKMITQSDGQMRPYVNIRGDLDALLARSVYYELAECAEEYNGRFGVWSHGIFHELEA